MKTSNNNEPLLRQFTWLNLIMLTIGWPILFYFFDLDWKTIIVLLVLWYPFMCYAIAEVKFYDDCITIIRPLFFLRLKRTIKYEQIAYMRVPGDYRLILGLNVYLIDGKRPIEIPLPLVAKKQNKLKLLLKTKGIKLEWDY